MSKSPNKVNLSNNFQLFSLSLRPLLCSLVIYLWSGPILASPEVLISGGGPAGLLQALVLHKMGIESVVVEKRPEYSRSNVVVLDNFATNLLSGLYLSPAFNSNPLTPFSGKLVEQFNLLSPPIDYSFASSYRLSRLEKDLYHQLEVAGIQVFQDITLLDVSPDPTNSLLKIKLSQGEEFEVMHLVIAEGSKGSSLTEIPYLSQVSQWFETGIISPFEFATMYLERKPGRGDLYYLGDPAIVTIFEKDAAYGFIAVPRDASDKEVEEFLMKSFAQNDEYKQLIDTSSLKLGGRFDVNHNGWILSDIDAAKNITILGDTRMSSSLLTGRGLNTAVLDVIATAKLIIAKKNQDPKFPQLVQDFMNMQKFTRNVINTTSKHAIPRRVKQIQATWPTYLCNTLLSSD